MKAKRLLTTLKVWSQNSEIMFRNKQRFRHERGKIFVYKDFQVRIYGFLVEGGFIFTNGAIKKRDAADPKELDRADEIRQRYLELHNE